jgi:hypothetical protein
MTRSAVTDMAIGLVKLMHIRDAVLSARTRGVAPGTVSPDRAGLDRRR